MVSSRRNQDVSRAMVLTGDSGEEFAAKLIHSI